MHFYNAKHSANFIKSVLEKKEETILKNEIIRSLKIMLNFGMNWISIML